MDMDSVFFSPQDVPAQRVRLDLGAPDTDPISEAQAYQRQRDGGMTLGQVASAANESCERVTRRLALLSLAPDMQHHVRVGHLSSLHAAQLVNLTPSYQRMVFIAYANGKLKTSAAFMKLVQDIRQMAAHNRRLDHAAHLAVLNPQADLDTPPALDTWAGDGGAPEILPEQN